MSKTIDKNMIKYSIVFIDKNGKELTYGKKLQIDFEPPLFNETILKFTLEQICHTIRYSLIDRYFVKICGHMFKKEE